MTTQKYLVLGSGPGLSGWWDRNKGSLHGFQPCPINNAWSVVGVDAVKCWFRSLDFFVKGTVLPEGAKHEALTKKEVTVAHHKPFNYNRENTKGTMIFGVLGHLFNITVTRGESAVVAVACSDMVYGEGDTHFYGVGSPDPLAYDHLLSTWFRRTVNAYASARIPLVNVGPVVDGTRLPLPRAALEEFP